MASHKLNALREVRKQLQTAIELEHSTIPPYMYAFWTVKDHTTDLADIIYDVIKEEMLHMGLACNILNALGGSPRILSPSFIPDYPTPLPAHDNTCDPFTVHLGKLDKQSIVTFLHIELPRDLGLEDHTHPEPDTIGEFYNMIMDNLKVLDDKHFSHGRQIAPQFGPYKQGDLMQIHSKADAFKAIDEILEQGEGLSLVKHKLFAEPSHYEKFMDIYHRMGGTGTVEAGHFDEQYMMDSINPDTYDVFMQQVRNVVTDPKMNNADTEECRNANIKFNSAYSKLLDSLHSAFTSSDPDPTEGISAMFSLTRYALELMSIPVDPDDLSKGYCGPTFEYLHQEKRQ